VSTEAIHLSRGELEDATALLWPALADPTRRSVLDLLRDRPRTTGEIAEQFTISRVAVMRHLEVLASAGLITSRKRGRKRWHYLNAVPLRRVHERWADPLASSLASGLLRLKERVETEGSGLDSTRPAVDVALEVAMAATPAVVFSALTEDPGGWWGHPFLTQTATGLGLEPRLGGLFIEHWDDGGCLIATVTGWSRLRHLELTGPFHLGVALGVATFDLGPADDGTLLRFAFRAVGAVDSEVAERMAQGWSELVGTRLKALVERGDRLGIAPDAPDLHRIRTENRND
jgi:DNA-binding transcriptional ArsR family regulator